MSSSIAPNLARIPAGDFLMGAADAEEDERPVHRVFVSEFFIGRYRRHTTTSTRDSCAATGHPPPGVRDLPLIARGDREPHLPRACRALRLGRRAIRRPATAATPSSLSV